MPFDLQKLPVDRRSASALEKRGLTYRSVDPADRAELDAWVHADQRGFHHARPTAGELEHERAVFSERRLLGVYDATAAEPEIPVATISGWPTGLSVPGDRSVDAWAVSSVTVAPTHRRRGIARALLEAELRDAIEAGAALAVLTVTEATIYGRYGFAPAARSATMTVDRRRAHWTGPDAPGRVHLVEPASLRDLAPQLVRRAVARTPGEIDRWPGLLDRVLGLVEPDAERSRQIRAIRYDDEHGEPQGFATYRITREPDRPGVLAVDFVAAATDDADRALWRTLIEVDFIDEVRGLLRSVDEPLPWLLEDRRAVTVSDVVDHLWVRVLDPVAALRARRYGAPGSLTLEIDDPLGHAGGTYELEVAGDGRAEVSRVDEAPADAKAGASRRRRRAGALRLGVHELGAIYLGDARPSTLARAGRITETARGAAALADRIFATSRAPQLSIWF
ncbi:GNAT family N-acetyltransferase [Agromyces aerolatus]|uniref:GNAT family N-acetyltransferase n=1 Tax=Agromyces sp. LY-1074 TaxID=3074080 RepID=UPI0028571271|nr:MULTISPECIES: GNAT family N-acetyltransferase [unclassified Agromyces]MDR5698224.1 GNAT family N-acetyltransferase [Agromyces sp. LY-1074]MDR5704518.1 GNAT family N-acetyltransferase [Agromyces sp. LY-1358]